MRVAVLIYDGVDLLDAGGPYEVFLTANRIAVRADEAEPFDLMVVSADGEPRLAYGGLGLVPTHFLAELGELDVIVVPGTIDVEGAVADVDLRAAVETLIGTTELVTSVCTGAFLLADRGLLDGRSFTTHWEDLDDLDRRVTDGQPVTGVRWVDAGRVVTSAGLSAGIDMALHLVDRLCGRGLAVATARQLDVAWDPDGR